MIDDPTQSIERSYPLSTDDFHCEKDTAKVKSNAPASAQFDSESKGIEGSYISLASKLFISHLEHQQN